MIYVEVFDVKQHLSPTAYCLQFYLGSKFLSMSCNYKTLKQKINVTTLCLIGIDLVL